MAALRKTNGHKWQKVRERVMSRDCGLCQECNRQGRITLGSEVDHIIPLNKHGTDDDSNLQLLCHECHVAKTNADMNRRAPIGYDGWPIG
jgi:5-methylcytosine-specific restriction enzyme A